MFGDYNIMFGGYNIYENNLKTTPQKDSHWRYWCYHRT
jgi:hypothetical protein